MLNNIERGAEGQRRIVLLVSDGGQLHCFTAQRNVLMELSLERDVMSLEPGDTGKWCTTASKQRFSLDVDCILLL